MHNLVLVDKRVTDYAAIVDAVDISNDVHYIVFDIFDLGPDVGGGPGPGPFAAMQAKISELNIPAFNSIGLVQHNNNAPFYQMFGPACPQAMITDVKTSDASLQTWQSVSDFITWLKTNFGIVNFDLMACALYSDANWKYVIDTLTVQTGVTIRASTDDTGAAGLGGNWFLESHTGVNLKGVYFTEAIENYRGVLAYQGSDNYYIFSSKRRPIKSYAVGGLQLWGDVSEGGQNNTGVDLTSGIVGVCSDDNRFVALKTNGSVVAWGRVGLDANYTSSATVVAVPTASLTTGVIDIVKNRSASAAIKSDGSVVIWGFVGEGGNNNTGVNISTGVVNVYSAIGAFAALKNNGSVVCWGISGNGGSTTVPNNVTSSLSSGIVSVYGNGYSFAAVNISGGVITWGDANSGANMSSVSSSLTSGVVAVYATDSAYAALKNNGSLIIWGNSTAGGTNPGLSVSSDVIHVYPKNYGAFALKTDGSVVGWGSSSWIGTTPTLTNVVTICSSRESSAALKSDGSVIVWGDAADGGSLTSPVNVASDLSSGVIALYSSYYSFAALKSNGSVVTWGNTSFGGNSSTVASSLISGVVSITSTGSAFAALKSNGSVITWGSSSWGGSNNTSASISSGIVDIFNTTYSFAALKPTSTPSYDLSGSYYLDIDRLNILRSRDYRRSANLVTLNSNVFTLSATRSLQIFNPSLPNNKPLTMIVPDYQTAPYSLTSTITLPTSIVGSNSMLITSEIGERVDISGVGTYVNYGTYVYKVETNGTYTKTTSLTINSISYNLYGGDGVYSSGIALYNPTSTTPTLSNFSVSAKTYGTDTSFNLTDPSSNSPAGFTFSSSNTQVATISGRTVTIVGPGTSVITASQGGSGNFMNADISASLVVAFGNLSSLSSKALTDGPFVIPTPLSNVLTTYGTTWNKLGADIDGEAAVDHSGHSVSVSADGTVVAIGAFLNDGTSGTVDTDNNRGHVRVYKYTPGKAAVTNQDDLSFGPIGWTRLGADIDGEFAGDYSGYSVSLSADGTVVAIGAPYADGSGNLLSDSGHVRVYKYTPGKAAVTNQNDLSFGPVGWTRLGADIDGESYYNESGYSVSLSADGTIVAIGAPLNSGSDFIYYSGHVRVYKYNPNKMVDVSNQSLSTFGPAGWDRLGGDIDSEVYGRRNGHSVSLSADGTRVAIGTSDFTGALSGHRVRVYKYNANKIQPQLSNQSLTTFGPVGWDRLGGDIDGEAAGDYSGSSVSLSADGNIVAIGAFQNDGGNSASDNRGHVRVYRYNPNKTIDVSNQSLTTFGPVGWDRLGGDIDGEAADDYSGYSVSLSADGNIVAIGAYQNGADGLATNDRGHVRIYRYTPSKTLDVTTQTDASFGPIGWTRIGVDIDGEAAGDLSGRSVSLSTDGTTVAIGAIFNDGTGSNAGHVRVYKIDTSGNYTYTSSNPAVADICGNIVLPKSIGSTTINVTQAASGANTSKTATAQLTLSYAPTYQTYTIASKNFEDAPFDLVDPSSNSTGAFTFTSSNTSVATISGRTVTIVGGGTTTITATQDTSGDYATGSVTALFTVNLLTTVLGALTVPAKTYGTDTSFNLTDPTSNSPATITYTSGNTQVATISGRTVTIVGPGTSVITASQAAGNYTAASTTASLVVAFGNLSSLSSKVITDGPFVIPAPLSNVLTTYGTTWNKLGADIDGEVTNDRSGERGAVSISADGTVVAIGAVYNDGTSGTVDTTDSRGHVRVYKYTPGKAAVTVQTDSSFGPVGWTRLGADIDGEAAGDNSGYMVSLSADGTTVAIGAYYADGSGNLTSDNRGHVRVYKYTPGKGAVTNQNDASFGPIGWTRLGEDIDGEAVNDNVHSVSLSADGTVVAIGSTGNGGGGNRGQVRVYKYTPNKTVAVTNQNDASFGPVGWTRLGVDIYGEATNDESGRSISLSANGTVIAIGAYNNDGSGNAATDNRGHVRVYKYNPNKTVDVSNQSLSTFGPAGWDRLGADIDGESAGDQSGGKIWDSGSVSLSADGTTVAIGAWQNDGSGNLTANSGHVRVYKYNPNKTVDVSNQSLSTFGPAGWDRLGADIDGEATGDQSGISVSLSSDGTIVAIGANQNDGPGASTDNRGHVRIYRYTPSKTLAVTTQTDASFGPIGWTRIGADIDGETAGDAAAAVSLSADGTTVAFGSAWNDSTGVAVDTGHVRVYRIDTSGNYTYTSSNPAVADICGNIVLPKSGGSTTITVTQAASGANTSKTATAQLMLGYAPTYQTYTIASKNFEDAPFDLVDPSSNSTGAFTFTSSNTSVATISGRTVTITGAGSTTITATQAASGDYITSSTTASFTVNPITSITGTFTVPTKVYGDAPFNLDDPSSNRAVAFTYTSSNTQVATISGRTVTIIGPGVSVITASQGPNFIDVSASLVVAFGNLSSLSSKVLTDGPFVIPTPLSNVVTTYGTTWNKLGANIYGEAADDRCGFSVSMSADGTIVAIAAVLNDGTSGNVDTGDNRGHVRVYKYTPGKGAVTVQTDLSFGPIGWTRLGADIDGEAAGEQFGAAVSISADGTVVAISTFFKNSSAGRVRVFAWNGSAWIKRGGNIDGEVSGDKSGQSVSISADGNVVAIGAQYNDGSGNLLSDSGHVRVYKYDVNKTVDVSNQSLSTFGPIGWTRLGADIDGEAAGDLSGYSVSLSADGTVVAIGAHYNDGSGNVTSFCGHVRVYKYNPNKTIDVSNQSLTTFGPAGWDRLGADIDGEAAGDESGVSVSLSADGTTVAIGAQFNDGSGNLITSSGHVRVYKYNPNKTVDVSNQSLSTFGPAGWDRLGGDIDGEAYPDYSGQSVSLSADGTIVAIGAQNKEPAGGRVRIFKYRAAKTQPQLSTPGATDFGPAGWDRLGANIDGEANADGNGWSVSLSADGTTVAIGARGNDGPSGTQSAIGLVRIYRIDTSGNYTYTIGNSAIADICGNIVLPKTIGSTTINVTQAASGANPSKTATAQLMLGYAPTIQPYTIASKTIVDAPFDLADPSSNSTGAFTFTSSNASVATISGRTVTITGAGSTTITVTQAASGDYAAASTTASFTVNPITTVLGALTVPAKTYGTDTSFNLADPTSNNTGGAFTFTSGNTQVATISGRTVTIVGPGVSVITASQAAGNYTAASTTASLVVAFGNLTSVSGTIGNPFVIPAPLSTVATTYGTTWNKLGADIIGKVAGDESGTSLSVSADGTIVAIGARSNTSNRGTVRVYKYNDISWNQLGADINGEASSDYSGQSVSISANGRVVAIGANMNDGSGNLLPDSGHVRIYEFNGSSWVQRGGDIDGEANGDQSGISVSLSEDGSIVAIGAIMNDGSGNALSNSGHVRVYKYNSSKSDPQLTNQSLSTFGPAGWDRLGGDIDGEAVNDQSGFSVSLSVDGTIVAIGAIFNDGTSGTVDTSNNMGHVRVYRYNASKTDPQLTNQGLTTFGPAGWDRMGSDIDGEVAADQTGFSLSLSADGSTVAIGAPLYDASGSNSGRVRVFAWNGTSWGQRGGNINGIALNENLGDSVSLSADGSILSVGSFMKVANYSYNSSINAWSQIGANIISPTKVAISNALSYSPHVYLDATNPSSYSSGTWTNLGSLSGNVVMTNMGTFDANDNGGSFNFNGTSNYGQLTIASSTLTSLTYVAVVKSSLKTGYASILDFGNDNLLFVTSNNILSVYNPTISSGFTLTAGVWYFLSVTIATNGSAVFYVNGVSVFSTTGTALTSRTNTVWGIGSGIPGANELWNGKISALAIYHNKVLTASEIANLYSSYETYKVSISSQGNIVAIGAREYDGVTGASTNIGATRVYKIDTSGNYTYTIGNSAIADICGNIVLPKSGGSTTITVTQSASGANTSKSATVPLVLNLTTTTITRTTDASGTISKTFAPGLSFSVAATSSRGSAVTYSSSDTTVATVDSSSGLVTVLKAGSATLTAAQTQTSQYAAGSASWALTVALGTNPWSNTFAITSPVAFGDTVTYTAPALSYSPAGAITYSTTTDVSNVATINSSSGAITLVGNGTVTFRATTAETSQYASSTIDSSAITVNRAMTTITRTTDASGTILKTYVPDLSFSVAATSSRGIGSAVTYSSSDTTVATVDSTSGLVTVLKAGSATLTAAQTETTQYTAGSASWALTVALGTNPWSNTFAITSPVAFGDTITYTAPALSYSPAGAITYSTTTDVSNVATINSSSGAITLVGNGTVTFRATTAETSQYASSYIDTSVIRVNRATTTITRASDAYVDGAISKTYVPDLSFSLTATSSRTDGSAISYTSSDTTVATVDSSSGLVTVLKAGTTTITASQSTTFQYSAGSNTWDLTVALGTNPWSNTFSVSSSAVFGDTITYTAPAVTYGQGGAITYSTTTDVSNVATINASTGAITIVGYGTVTFRATTAETSQYASSSIDSSAVTINRATTTITRASDAYVGGTISKTYVPDLSFSVAATSSRGIGSAVTYSSSDTTVATVDSSSGLVTVLKAGPTTITAAQTETTQYTAGSASWALTVLPGTNAWSNTFAITSPVTFGDTVTYTAPALSYSPAGAITYSTTTDVSNVAIINSTTGAITLVGYGTVTFRATTAATSQYASSYIDSSAITVNRATTTITRRNDDYVAGVISKMYVTDLSFSVAATSSRPGETAVTYSSSDTTVATVNSTSGRVTVLKAGTATITASQTATAQYTAGSISWAFTNGLGINPWANTFSITSPVTFGDTVTYTPPVATYSPAGAITYGTTTDASNVAIIDSSSGVITLVGYGTVTFTATQAETEQYDDSTIHSSVVTVNRATTTITRASDAYVSGTISKTYSPDLSFNIAATSSRPGGAAVSYSSSDTSVATVDASGRVTILSGTATGSPVTLTAYQAENAQYAYGSITWSLTVSLASNTITRGTNFADATITRTYDPTSTTFNVSASSNNSISDIVFTSSDTNVASITRVNATTSQITINTAGSITITASQSASSKYAAATDISCALVINRRIATLFRSAPYSNSTVSKYYEPASFYLTASSVSDGAVTYESSNTNVAHIDTTSGEVTLYSLGSTTITASQANSSRYTTPINISWALDISSGNTTITGIPTDVSKNVTNVPFYLAASSASSGAITYSLTDPSSNVATVNVSSGLVTLFAPGTFTVTVSQAGTSLYNAPTSVSSTITVSSAGNILENVTVNPAIQNFVNVDLSGASLAGSTISNVSFNGASLAGASLVGTTAIGTSFVNAILTNVDFSGANISGADFTNANISGANISDLDLSTVQKLQLLKNINNREITEIQIPENVAGSTIMSVIPQNSEVRQVPNIETSTFKVIVPYTTLSSTASLLNTVIDPASTVNGFYLPLNTGEYFKINGIKYYTVGTTVKNFATNATVEVITNNGIQYRLFVGSVTGVALEANTLSASTFTVPSVRLIGDTEPIYTTTFPTSNSNAAIVYSSTNPSVATINATTGQITMVSAGSVTFTASQAATLTYASGSKTSNQLTIYSTQVKISFNVSALDSTLQMDVSGAVPEIAYQLPTSDATSVFYVKLSDMKEVFKFQTDSFDVNDVSLSDIRYYVYKNKWPSTIKLNPAHSMVDVSESNGMMGSSGMFAQNKALLKHDYVRYLAYKLFRTIHGVDLFKNESDLLENISYWGETIRNAIENKLDLISTTSSDETIPMDGSGNRFLTNATTTNTNITRELMMQIVGNSSSRNRLFNISGTTGIQSVPLMENDSFNIVITVFAAENQNILTGSDSISSRTYNMKVVLKNDITGLNVPVIDSEMFPNAYSYSGNVAVITADSSANYADYSPPTDVPVARYGFNGWYYKNTSAWVTVDPTVRNKIKWSVSPNTVSSKVSNLQYIRFNAKIYNKTSLPYITVYTASSKRAYLVSNSADISNNGKYTFYVNFGAYDRLPAVIDHTNKELTVSSSGALTQGSFDNNETITRIAVETDSAASYNTIEFTMSCIVVGETSGEKEHWFQ